MMWKRLRYQWLVETILPASTAGMLRVLRKLSVAILAMFQYFFCTEDTYVVYYNNKPEDSEDVSLLPS